MTTFTIIFLANVASVLVLISVHELGHYLAGLVGGIPARAMQVRLLTFPQHVALRDGDDRVAPFDLDRYLAIMRRHLRSDARLFLYTAGGFLLETAFTVATTVAAKSLGWPGLALIVAGQSAGMYLIYLLLMDLPQALRRGYPWGDTSGLWFISRAGAALLTALLLGVRALLVWYAVV